LGVSVATTAALAKAQYATGGLLPQAITGLSSQTVAGLVGADPVTNKLRPAAAGDDGLGYASPGGAVLLNFPGRVT
jgi:hypothetical protein